MTRAPLVLASDERLFEALHARLLRSEHDEPPWHALAPEALDDAARERHRAAWSARVTAEYRSMVVFGELLARLPELRLPLAVSASAARLITDEARHTEYCARLATALGGHDDALLDDASLRLYDGSLDARLFVARWVASMFCVGECVSVGLLQVMHAQSTDPCVRAVLATLRRDEALHDRFGWALARAVFPRLSGPELDWLGADLAFAFAHYERIHTAGRGERARDALEEVAAREAPSPAMPAGANLGVADRASYAAAFYDRIERVVLPSLAQLGVPAYEAWALRHEAR